MEVGTERGTAVLDSLNHRPATEAEVAAARGLVAEAARSQSRSLETEGLKEFLYNNFENPHWDRVVERCLTCGKTFSKSAFSVKYWLKRPELLLPVAAGLQVLAKSEEAGVHLAVSEDGFRIVFFQGHPEYDTISLLKEYKREVLSYAAGSRKDYPPYPRNYLNVRELAVLDEYRLRLDAALSADRDIPEFPEALVADQLDNTWHDTAEAVVGNWMGAVYQVTHSDRRVPFMEGVDPDDPLGLREYTG